MLRILAAGVLGGTAMFTARSNSRGFPALPNAYRQFRRSRCIRYRGRNTGRNRDQHFLLELVRLSVPLHRQLYVHPDCRLLLRRYRRSAGLTKRHTGGIAAALISAVGLLFFDLGPLSQRR
jgi:hypothetical protein